MIPALLNTLTVIFIFAGLVLLWLNLRVWRRNRVAITPENYDGPEEREKRSALQLSEAESPMAWSTPFDDWIDLPDGRKLITLKDAATYITELPEDERRRQEWQKAARSLLGAAEHQDLLTQAHIDVLRAIPRNQASSPIPIGKIRVGESGG